jgi:tetratricopeptide (TPR) repeat protein
MTGEDSERTAIRSARTAGEAEDWVHKGDALRAGLRYEEAVKCYDCALELDPDNPMVWSVRGRALSAVARNQEALACYEKALAIDPGYLLAWAGKARELRGLGKKEEAAVCLKKYRALAGKQV